MAISFSQEFDRTVLLVEADLRKPSLKELMGLDADLPGLADHLLDRRPIQEILFRPDVNKLDIIPAGRGLLNSVELLGSQRMRDLVSDLKGRYRAQLIIFDTPPLLVSADAQVFSEMVDAIVMVVEAGRTSMDKINRARKLLDGKNLIGLILNKTRQDGSFRI